MSTSPRGRRIEECDAIRGIALLLVFVSHFSWTLDIESDQLAELFRSVGMIATPTFLVLSGLMLGLLWRVSGQRDTVQSALLNRGVILIGAHFLISAAAIVPGTDSYGEVAFGSTFATDAIAVSILVGPLLLRHVRGPFLPIFAVALYTGSWLVAVTVNPSLPILEVAREVLVGRPILNEPLMNMSSPILPYFAFYILGGWLSSSAFVKKDGTTLSVRAIVLWIGGAGVVCVALAIVLNLLGEHLVAPILELKPEMERALFSRYQKGPPGPVYSLFYGGLAACLCAALLAFRHPLRRALVLPALSLLGRASLPVFVLQFFVYAALAKLVATGVLPFEFATVYFLVSVAILWLIAWAWDGQKLNRFLDIGLRVRYGAH